MAQIDIYDLLTPDDLTSVNFRTMTIEEIAQTLGARLGLEFKFNGFFNEWNKKKMAGSSGPFNSMSEAYAFLNRAKERARE